METKDQLNSPSYCFEQYLKIRKKILFTKKDREYMKKYKDRVLFFINPFLNLQSYNVSLRGFKLDAYIEYCCIKQNCYTNLFSISHLYI